MPLHGEPRKGQGRLQQEATRFKGIHRCSLGIIPSQFVRCADGSNLKGFILELESLKNLTQLQSLDIFGNNVTDAGLENLKDLTHLQRLNLSQLRPSIERDPNLRNTAKVLSDFAEGKIRISQLCQMLEISKTGVHYLLAAMEAQVVKCAPT